MTVNATRRTRRAIADELVIPWPTDRLVGLHRYATHRRVRLGESWRTAELHALADVIACATEDERRQLAAEGCDVLTGRERRVLRLPIPRVPRRS
jgi:hypothetical protein